MTCPARSLLVAFVLLPLAIHCAVRPADVVADEPDLTPRQLWLRGRYAEALQAFAEAAEIDPVGSALGTARCLIAEGKADDAQAALQAAAAAHPHAEIDALQAEIALAAGDWSAASDAIAAALEKEPHCVSASWHQAELARQQGRLDDASAGYQKLVDFYNAHDDLDADQLLYIGHAAAQHARWNRLSDQFKFLVNEHYADLLAKEPLDWRAHYQRALLFLEKFNQAEAQRAIQAALAINPAAAEVHVAAARLALLDYNLDLAQRSAQAAREINPRLIEALLVAADVKLANFDTAGAEPILAAARSLNPRHEPTQGRLAAVEVIRAGELSEAFRRLEAEVLAQNAHPGEFYLAAATRLEDRRKFPEAEVLFRRAAEVMPQLPGSDAALGLMLMRLGREEEARKLLDAAFEADPYHVRVSNMLKVLDLLAGYETIESDHFLVRFDPAQDRLLAEMMLEYLEAVYPKLCKLLAFEPKGKTLFEVFNKGKNTDGHGWFSARLVGLPYIGTVGACAGGMVAVTSPSSLKEPFNWARVVEHELVHIINLQQTRFNLPHWFTEALAVWNEGFPRSAVWNQLLAQRVPRGDVFNLDTINLGFIRPKTNLDWQMAYCQAELYVEHLHRQFGPESTARLLEAYRDNLDTPLAIQRALGVDQHAFETGYQQFLKDLVAQLRASTAAEPSESFATLEQAHRASPDDVDTAARLARACLDRKNYPRARQLADEALERSPAHGLASYVKARLALVLGDDDQAIALLEPAALGETFSSDAVALLASLRLKRQEYEPAEALLTRGAAAEPANLDWQKRLATLYLRTRNVPRLSEALTRLAQADGDEFVIRKKLAELALERGDAVESARWAAEALHVKVTDAQAYRLLATAQERQGNAEALRAWRRAAQLAPDDASIVLGLARAAVAQKQPQLARQALSTFLNTQPGHAEALQLLESLKP